MTRKDTIIVAVLINAAILIALFVSAIRTEKEEKELISSSNQLLDKEMDLLKKNVGSEIKVAEGDEVDMALKQYSESNMNKEHSLNPSIAFAEPIKSDKSTNSSSLNTSSSFEKKFEKPIDFAQDLRAIAAPAIQDSPTSLVEVIVKKGDVLEKIARAHQTTVSEIMEMNQMKNTNLRIGQVLKVKSGGKNLIKTASEVVPEYYIVKKGDNPWTIAVKNHMKVEELLRLNNLDEEKARLLKPDDKLRIR